jgi:predicted transposase YbfD/YdcC
VNDGCGIKPRRSARFYVSSLSSNAKTIAGASRSHWGIENSLHWTLDVTFCEDESRIRKQNSPENFALLRRLAINLLKPEKTSGTKFKNETVSSGNGQ